MKQMHSAKLAAGQKNRRFYSIYRLNAPKGRGKYLDSMAAHEIDIVLAKKV